MKEKEYGTNLGKIVLGDSNFLSLEKPTLIVARREGIVDSVIGNIFVGLENAGAGDIQKIVLGGICAGAKCYADDVEIKKGMVEVYNYIKTLSTFLALNRCKNMDEYNKKFRKSGARLVVVLKNLERFSRMENFLEIEPILNFLITKASEVGVAVIATTAQIERLALNEGLFYKFSNRLIFGGLSGEVVKKLTLGMYRSTTSLTESEFYYMTMNRGNGSLLAL